VAYLPTVLPSEVDAWNQYATDNQGWIQDSHGKMNVSDSVHESIWENPSAEIESTCDIPGHNHHRKIMSRRQTMPERVAVLPESGPFSPVWTFSPPPDPDDVSIINFDLKAQPMLRKAMEYVSSTKEGAYLNVCNFATWFDSHEHDHELQGLLVFPVFDGPGSTTSAVVGHLIAVIPWSIFFRKSYITTLLLY